MLIYFSRYFNSLASKVYLYVRGYVNLLVCIVTCRWDFISHAKSMAPKNSPSNNNNYEKTGWSRCNFYLFIFPQKQDRLTLSAWSLFFRAVCNNIPQLILNTWQRLIINNTSLLAGHPDQVGATEDAGANNFIEHQGASKQTASSVSSS